MKLEAVIDPGCKQAYPVPSGNPVRTTDLLQQIVGDILKGVPNEIISAKFHRTLALLITDKSMEIAVKTGIRKVVLSGGVFQNRYLLELAGKKIRQHGLDLYVPSEVPCNDGGIALGQLYVAANRLNRDVSRSTRTNR